MAKNIDNVKDIPANPSPQVFKDEEWKKLYMDCEDIFKEDPSLRLMASASWQTSTPQEVIDSSRESLPTDSEARGTHPRKENLQEASWNAYRTEGPINAYVHSTVDMVTGKGFGCYSDNRELDLYLKDFFYSYRNQLYSRVYSWMVRMIAEGELFLLLAFDEEGKATVRTLEPGRIKGDEALILNPDDAADTLYYRYSSSSGEDEIIPSVSIMYNPELENLVKDKVPRKLLKKSIGKKLFSKVGGYRRFVVHWKNLTGIHEYLRDVPYISTTLEYFYLYKNALKWGLDYKKAQSSYAIFFKFDESPVGKWAWHLWQRMSDEARAKTGLTKPITPGSRLFLMPGISCEIKAPQFSKLSGENQDLLNMAGAGARSPQDLWQGQSSGASHASLRASRSPLEIFIANLQDKFSNFFKYELLRPCFYISSSLGKVQETYKKDVAYEDAGKITADPIDVEPCELVSIVTPKISLEQNPEQQAGALFGSKNSGLIGLGVSDSEIANRMGVEDLSRQRRIKEVERKTYGDPDPVVE